MSAFTPGAADRLARRAAAEACRLAGDVRDLHPTVVWRHLQHLSLADPGLLMATVIALAAAMPVERPYSALIAWTDALDNEGVA